MRKAYKSILAEDPYVDLSRLVSVCQKYHSALV